MHVMYKYTTTWKCITAEARLLLSWWRIMLFKPHWTVIHLPKVLVDVTYDKCGLVLRCSSIEELSAVSLNREYALFFVPIIEHSEWGVYTVATDFRVVRKIWNIMPQLRTELRNES